ncbi:MAG: hypothetical protein WD009_01105 [Phycisphaeraceae bacterium]
MRNSRTRQGLVGGLTLMLAMHALGTAAHAQQQPMSPPPSVDQRLDQVIEADLSGTLQEAFESFSEASGIPVIINWNMLEIEAGVRPRQQSGLPQMPAMPADQMLQLLVSRLEATGFEELRYDYTDWYVEIITYQQANHPSRMVRRDYVITGLLIDVPHFIEAAEFDLDSVVGGSGGGGGSGGFGGGGGGGGRGGRGGGQGDADIDEEWTTRDRAIELADTIRATIEPDIWMVPPGMWEDLVQDNSGGGGGGRGGGGRGGRGGGQNQRDVEAREDRFASIRYFRGRRGPVFAINAPRYVHRMIERPTPPVPVATEPSAEGEHPFDANVAGDIPRAPRSAVNRGMGGVRANQ